jgi:hypothetical protein
VRRTPTQPVHDRPCRSTQVHVPAGQRPDHVRLRPQATGSPDGGVTLRDRAHLIGANAFDGAAPLAGWQQIDSSGEVWDIAREPALFAGGRTGGTAEEGTADRGAAWPQGGIHCLRHGLRPDHVVGASVESSDDVNVWPRIETFGEPRTYGEPGYRDALCGLIGRTVTAADESEADGLVLQFDTDRLVVNPEPFEVAGPEIALLAMNDDEGTWTVWRPGEGPFANREW